MVNRMINSAVSYIHQSVKNLKDRPNGAYETSHMNIPLELVAKGGEYYDADFTENVYKPFVENFTKLKNIQDDVHMDLEINAITKSSRPRVSFEITVFKDSKIGTAVETLVGDEK